MTTPQTNQPRALLAYGDHELRCLFRRALERASYKVIACPRAIDFLARVGVAGEYDLVVCDVQWLDELSISLIRSSQQQRQYPPLVLIDAADEPISERLASLTPAAVICKPLEVMRRVAQMHALRADQRQATIDQ